MDFKVRGLEFKSRRDIVWGDIMLGLHVGDFSTFFWGGIVSQKE